MGSTLMETIILQPIEFLEQFPHEIINEEWLEVVQKANQENKLLIIHVERRFGAPALASVKIYGS